MLPGELWAAAVSTRENFENYGRLEDLDAEVDLYRRLRAAGAPPRDVPSGHELDIKQSCSLQLRARFYGYLDDLEEAISLVRAASESCTPSCPDHPALLATLASGLRMRHDISGDRSCLETSLQHSRVAVELCSSESPCRSLCLYEFGCCLMAAGVLSLDLESAERAIDAFRQILAAPDTSAHLRHQGRVALGHALWYRYNNFGGPTYLEEALSTTRHELESRRPEHAFSADVFNTLSRVMYALHIKSGAVGDLDEAEALAQKALSLQQMRDTTRVSSLINIACSMAHRVHYSNEFENLKAAMGLYREALSLLKEESPQRASILHNLGGCLAMWFGFSLDMTALEESLVVLRSALALRGPGHPRRSATLDNLGNILMQRYRQLGQRADIDEAINYHRAALSLRRNGDPRYIQSLTHLALALSSRHDYDLCDLEESIALLKCAVELPSGPVAFVIRAELGVTLARRGEASSSMKDIEESITYVQQAIHLAPSFLHLQSTRRTLAIAHHVRFKVARNEEDLIEALAIYYELLAGDCTDIERFRITKHLAEALTEPGTSICNLEIAAKLARRNITDELFSPQLRLKEVVHFLRGLQDNGVLCTRADHVRHAEALLPVYEGAVHLLPHTAYFGAEMKSRLLALDKAESISLQGAGYALSLQMPDRALEILEQGRGVFWEQALCLRNPLNEVPQLLRDELLSLSRSLESRSYAANGWGHSKAEMEKEDARNRKETEQFNSPLDQARACPGLERFMLSEPASVLAEVGREGPVIILVSALTGCYAIIITTALHIQSLVLGDIDEKWLLEASQSWGYAVGRGRNASAERMSMKKPNAGVKLRSRENSLLKELWNRVVEPILSALGLQPASGRNRPRLWWIPTGQFSFLPLHAAGVAGSKARCSSYVVSSYSPTVSALINARRSYRPVYRRQARVLLSGTSTSQFVSDLPQTSDEISTIQKIISGEGELETLHANVNETVQGLLDLLPQANVLHLACHGQQDLENPLESRFILHDGPITIATLVPLPLPNAFIAFLSACETAKGDESQPDQLIHLAAALLFAGFKSVIGTMWNMNDHDGPFVSKIVYQKLFAQDNDILDPNIIPYALDDAVQQLREQGVSPSRWATYIHLGM